MSVERVIPVPSQLPVVIRRELEAAQACGVLRMHDMPGALAHEMANSIIEFCTLPLQGLKAPTDPQIDLLNRKLNVMSAAMEMQTEMIKQYENLYGPLPKRA